MASWLLHPVCGGRGGEGRGREGKGGEGRGGEGRGGEGRGVEGGKGRGGEGCEAAARVVRPYTLHLSGCME